jgi:hypothetical protein
MKQLLDVTRVMRLTLHPQGWKVFLEINTVTGGTVEVLAIHVRSPDDELVGQIDWVGEGQPVTWVDPSGRKTVEPSELNVYPTIVRRMINRYYYAARFETKSP